MQKIDALIALAEANNVTDSDEVHISISGFMTGVAELKLTFAEFKKFAEQGRIY